MIYIIVFIFIYLIVYDIFKVIFLRDVTVGIRAKVSKMFWKTCFGAFGEWACYVCAWYYVCL